MSAIFFMLLAIQFHVMLSILNRISCMYFDILIYDLLGFFFTFQVIELICERG